MIEALDETIKQLLIQKTPLNLAEVDISFDVPNREWSSSISKPTINVYLHDIRENLNLKQNEWYNERNPDGSINRIEVGSRFDLSYIITAWTTNVEDEHRLLWYVLSTLVRFPVLPADVMQEPLPRQSILLHTKVAQPEGILRNAADVWTALDNQLKPVLTYVVTLAMDSEVMRTSKQVTSRFIRFASPDAENISALNRRGLNEQSEQLVSVGGRVLDSDKQPVRAEVVLVEQGLNVTTDEDGRYSFKNVVKRPKYTFLAVAPGFVTGRQELNIPATSYDIQLQRETELVNS